MHGEGWLRVVGGVMAIVAIAGGLLAVDTVSSAPIGDDRAPIEVLGQVESREPVGTSLPVSPVAQAAPAGTSTPSTVAPPTSTSIAPAPTTTVVVSTTILAPAPAAPTPEGRAAQAISEIGYPWQTRFPAWTIEIQGSRTGVRALTHPDQQRIDLFVRADDTVAELGRVLAHELGHVADLELNDDLDRQRWRQTRGVGADVPWWPTGTSFDFDTVAGDFAEGFAAWLVGSASQSRVGGPLTADQLVLMGELAG